MSGYYGNIIYLILGLCVGVILIFDVNHLIPAIIIIICLIAEVVLKLNRFKTNKVPRRTIGGLEINSSEIILNNRIIKIEDIQTINIELNDYNNKVSMRREFDFRGMYSEGIHNYIKISTKQNEMISFNFKINSKKHRLHLVDFFRTLVANDLISMEDSLMALSIPKMKKKLFIEKLKTQSLN